MNLRELQIGDIILFKGTGTLSRIIEKITQSEYSHAAINMEYGVIIEADWGGVQMNSLTTKYKNVAFDVFRHTSKDIRMKEAVTFFALEKVGKGYDYFGLAGILMAMVGKKYKNALDNKNKYWCSELVTDAYLSAGLPLCTDPNTYKISPQDISMFPQLKKVMSYAPATV